MTVQVALICLGDIVLDLPHRLRASVACKCFTIHAYHGQLHSSHFMNFSERLSLAMRIRAVNQSVLARRLSTSQSTVSRWFSGGVPHPSTMERIAKALSVSVSWLSAGIGEGPAGDAAPTAKPQGGEPESSEFPGPVEDSILDNWSRMELIKLARLLATTELGRKEILLKVLEKLDVPVDTESRAKA